MEAQLLQDIAVGCSDNFGGMMFFCPFNKEVYITLQYCLDESGHTTTDINIQYNGGMFIALYSSQSKSKS
eukprot:6323952-Ditylum_brightwellii.AAC.1